MGERRKARETALKTLYSLDLSGADTHSPLTLHDANEEASAETLAFAEELVKGVITNQEEIDSIITSFSSNWKISRMAVIDRNILRIGIFELKWRPDIPARVTLNETIEIGKQFGTEESGSFINGILDKVAKSINKE